MSRLAVSAWRTITDLKQDRKGATSMEYGIIAAGTLAAVGASIALIGGDMTILWNGIVTQFGVVAAA